MNMRDRLVRLYHECRDCDAVFLLVLLKGLYYKWHGANVVAHNNTRIRGIRNIKTNHKVLKIGLHNVGFTSRRDAVYMNIAGKLEILGNYTITQGCKFYIGKHGRVTIGDGGYVNAGTHFIIMHGLTIGSNCVISWNCQFLDEDYHEITYEGKTGQINEISIGNNVWIGCNAFIYKGVTIADGCVIAANAVVRKSVHEPNSLIAGNPARVVRTNVKWK